MALSTYLAAYKSTATTLGMSEEQYFIEQLAVYMGGGGSTVIDAVLAAATTASDSAVVSAITALKLGGTAALNASTLTTAATALNTVSTIMKRDAAGSFAATIMGVASVTVADLPSGGSVGSAASTVDVASVIKSTQSTAAQTLTLPSPTASAVVRTLIVDNAGSTPFTLLGAALAAGAATLVLWNGAAWHLVA